MKRLLPVLAVLFASSPLLVRADEAPSHGAVEHHAAEPGEAHEGHHAKREISEVVFGHVANARELEFENPLSGDETVIELPQMRDAFGVKGLDLSLSKHLVYMWLAAVLLIVGMVIFRPKTITPKGFSLILEMLVLFVRDELAKPNIGEKEYRKYTPYLLTCFFFILVINLLGLMPFSATATGNLGVTAALALCTFVLTQIASIQSAGIGGYLKHLTGGVSPALWPIMIPVEILGLFTKPFALCVRLFANMVAGHIVIYFLLGLIFIMKSVWVAPLSIAFATAIYFLEIFVAFLQAYVFTMLSAVFIGMGVAMGHHGDAHHENGENGDDLKHVSAAH
jgi:F-type H+-transporting ATPase subunit a